MSFLLQRFLLAFGSNISVKPTASRCAGSRRLTSGVRGQDQVDAPSRARTCRYSPGKSLAIVLQTISRSTLS
ncbi:DUF1010 domain-containing protein [Melaminivora suipulveris]|uniref:DUF1010 domain-containing protein n=1 Tax=Melaminivora suipulveris TaxID=2109913 RepID=UPI003AAFF582